MSNCANYSQAHIAPSVRAACVHGRLDGTGVGLWQKRDAINVRHAADQRYHLKPQELGIVSKKQRVQSHDATRQGGGGHSNTPHRTQPYERAAVRLSTAHMSLAAARPPRSPPRLFVMFVCRACRLGGPFSRGVAPD